LQGEGVYLKVNLIVLLRALHNTLSRHSGRDTESRKHLIILDTGLRRYDEIGDFVALCRSHIMSMMFYGDPCSIIIPS